MHFIFIYFFFSTLFLGLLYLHYGFIRSISRKKTSRITLSVIMLSFVAAVFLSFTIIKLKGYEGKAGDWVAWYAYLGIGYLSFLLFLTVARDIVFILWKMITSLKHSESDPHEPDRADRRVFFKQSASYAMAGTAFLLSGAGVRNAFASPMIKDVILPVKGLHPDLAGISIVQITDIHLGPTLKRNFMESVINDVKRLKPDLIALTGDLVDGYVSRLAYDAEPLKDLSAPFGKYFVTGNHEYYFKALEWIDHVESLGFTALNNTHTLIQKNDGKILLGGVTDLRGGKFIPSHRSDPFKAMEDAPLDTHVKILLAHQPKSVYAAEKAGFDIQISGHTHGGQFFPWTYIIGLDQPFLAGLYTHGKTRLYVSRGTGYWGPPMRLGSPSEITRFVLIPEKEKPHGS